MKKLNEMVIEVLKKKPEQTVSTISRELNSNFNKVAEVLDKLEEVGLAEQKLTDGRWCWRLTHFEPGTQHDDKTLAEQPVAQNLKSAPRKIKPNKIPNVRLPENEKERRIKAVETALSERSRSQKELSRICDIPYGSMDALLNKNYQFCRCPDNKLLWQLVSSDTPVYMPIKIEVPPVQQKSPQPIAIQEHSARFGVFDDGLVEIQKDGAVTKITVEDVKRLADFVERLAV